MNEYPVWIKTQDGRDRWDRMTPAQRAFRLGPNSPEGASRTKKKLADARKAAARRYYIRRWQDIKSDETYLEASREAGRRSYHKTKKLKTQYTDESQEN